MDDKKVVNISIIILTWKRTDLLRQCIQSIKMSGAMGFCEIIVVINGQDKNTHSYLINEPAVQCLALDKRLGRGEARNLAVEVAKGNIVYFIDDDVLLAAETLHNLWEKWQGHPRVAAIGGPNINMPDENILQRCCSRVLASRLGSGPFVSRYRRRRNDFYATDNDLSLCNLSFRKNVFRKDSFSNGVFSNEENILLQTLEKNGRKFLYAQNVYVHHHRGDKLKDIHRKCVSYGQGRADNLFVNAKGATFYGLFAALIAVYLVMLVLHYREWQYWTPIMIYFLSCSVESVIQSIRFKEKDMLRFSALLCCMFLIIHVSYIYGLVKGIARNILKRR